MNISIIYGGEVLNLATISLSKRRDQAKAGNAFYLVDKVQNLSQKMQAKIQTCSRTSGRMKALQPNIRMK